MVWEGQPQRAARATHTLGVCTGSSIATEGDPRGGGRSLLGRVDPAFGNPHDGCEVGLRLYLLTLGRPCGHKVDSE